MLQSYLSNTIPILYKIEKREKTYSNLDNGTISVINF